MAVQLKKCGAPLPYYALFSLVNNDRVNENVKCLQRSWRQRQTTEKFWSFSFMMILAAIIYQISLFSGFENFHFSLEIWVQANLWNVFFALSNALEGILPFSLTMFSNADVKNLVFMGSFRISEPSPVMEITSLGLFSPQYFMSRDATTCRSLLVLSRTYWKKNQSVWNHLPFKDNCYVSKNATSTYIGDIVL